MELSQLSQAQQATQAQTKAPTKEGGTQSSSFSLLIQQAKSNLSGGSVDPFLVSFLRPSVENAEMMAQSHYESDKPQSGLETDTADDGIDENPHYDERRLEREAERADRPQDETPVERRPQESVERTDEPVTHDTQDVAPQKDTNDTTQQAEKPAEAGPEKVETSETAKNVETQAATKSSDNAKTDVADNVHAVALSLAGDSTAKNTTKTDDNAVKVTANTAGTEATRSKQGQTLDVGASAPVAGKEPKHGLETALQKTAMNNGDGGKSAEHKTDKAQTVLPQNIAKQAEAELGKAAQARNDAASNVLQQKMTPEAAKQAENIAKMLPENTGAKIEVTTTEQGPTRISSARDALSAETRMILDKGEVKTAAGQSEQVDPLFKAEQPSRTASARAETNLQQNMAQANNAQKMATNTSSQTAAAKGGENFAQTLKSVGNNTQTTQAQNTTQPLNTGGDNVTAPSASQHARQTEAGAKTARAQNAQTPKFVEPKQVVEQIKVNIAKGAANGLDKIKIQLNPRELGTVEVKLDMSSDGKIQASISASRPETLDMLQKDAKGLEKAMADAGLKMDSQSMEFNLRGEQQQTPQQQQMAGDGRGNGFYNAGTANDNDAFDDDLSLASVLGQIEQDIVTEDKVNIRI